MGIWTRKVPYATTALRHLADETSFADKSLTVRWGLSETSKSGEEMMVVREEQKPSTIFRGHLSRQLVDLDGCLSRELAAGESMMVMNGRLSRKLAVGGSPAVMEGVMGPGAERAEVMGSPMEGGFVITARAWKPSASAREARDDEDTFEAIPLDWVMRGQEIPMLPEFETGIGERFRAEVNERFKEIFGGGYLDFVRVGAVGVGDGTKPEEKLRADSTVHGVAHKKSYTPGHHLFSQGPKHFRRADTDKPNGGWFRYTTGSAEGDVSDGDRVFSETSSLSSSSDEVSSLSSTELSRPRRNDKRKSKRNRKKTKKSSLQRRNVTLDAPSKYDGTPDLEKFDEWTFEVDMWCRWNRVKSKDAVMLLSGFLSGKARRFFMNYVAPKLGEWDSKAVYEGLFDYCKKI